MVYNRITDYKKDVLMRSSFNELAGLTFGIDFERWYQLGFWNDRYKCYSFEYGGKVVANVSVNLLELLIDGKRVSAVQIGTVMTHPDHRRKGLAEELMNIVLTEYEKSSDLIFLFGNLDAVGFYSRFDFSTVIETQFQTKMAIGGMERLRSRRLDLTDMQDVEILRRLASCRVPLSSAFGVGHAEGILEWHCLNIFPKELIYLEELDTIVIYRIKDGKIELYDVISENRHDLQKILGAILPTGTYGVNFHFTPEQEGINVERKPYIAEDYIFYVKSASVHLAGEFLYPYTAHA